jgi:hypothetical protein
MTGFLSNPSTQSMAYWSLGSAAVATAAAALLLPGYFAGLMFCAATDPVVDSIARAAGATLIASATVKYTLKVRLPALFQVTWQMPVTCLLEQTPKQQCSALASCECW